jgi:hypothetical protein
MSVPLPKEEADVKAIEQLMWEYRGAADYPYLEGIEFSPNGLFSKALPQKILLGEYEGDIVYAYCDIMKPTKEGRNVAVVLRRGILSFCGSPDISWDESIGITLRDPFRTLLESKAHTTERNRISILQIFVKASFIMGGVTTKGYTLGVSESFLIHLKAAVIAIDKSRAEPVRVPRSLPPQQPPVPDHHESPRPSTRDGRSLSPGTYSVLARTYLKPNQQNGVRASPPMAFDLSRQPQNDDPQSEQDGTQGPPSPHSRLSTASQAGNTSTNLRKYRLAEYVREERQQQTGTNILKLHQESLMGINKKAKDLQNGIKRMMDDLADVHSEKQDLQFKKIKLEGEMNTRAEKMKDMKSNLTGEEGYELAMLLMKKGLPDGDSLFSDDEDSDTSGLSEPKF